MVVAAALLAREARCTLPVTPSAASGSISFSLALASPSRMKSSSTS